MTHGDRASTIELKTQTVTSDQLDVDTFVQDANAIFEQLATSLNGLAQTPPLTQYQALQAVVTAAARIRHAVEQGNGIARYEAWRDMCAALDALGVKA